MDQSLITRMHEYLAAGLAMDVEALDELYDPTFENVRTDEAGQVATLAKEQFMLHFRAVRDQGKRVGDSVDDVRFLATLVHGDQGTVVVHREQHGTPVRYCFVWQRAGGRWTTLLRELSFERDITPLIAAIEAARAATA
ncbi:DUF4440 domain-containing protein [Kitasatospora sp. NPDC058965]|uniref:DUF4440 domain-containing protein n=1 Tax=Kitasatospora sp. NPDC058965 TaxID=3346682 RepID=UPI00368E41F2